MTERRIFERMTQKMTQKTTVKMTPKMGRNMAQNRGFTLIEMMIALSLMALFLAPVLYFQQSSTKGLALNRDEVAANCAAYELIEQILSMPYEDVPVGTFGESQIVNQQGLGSGTTWPLRLSDAGQLSRRLEISEVSADARARYKKITATLSLPAAVASGTGRTFTRTVLYAKETL